MSITRRPISPLAIIFAIVFLDLLGFGILIPVIPQLLANPESPYYLLPPSMTKDQGLILLGLLTAIFPLGQFVANPILGQLSDRYGRRKILAWCLLGTALSYFFFGYGIIIASLPVLFISRFVDGITGGNISVAQAVIADISEPQDRAKNFGLLGAAFGLGFIMGPFLGGKLSDPTLVSWFDAATPFWFATILGIANWIAVILYLPETLAVPKESGPIKATQSLVNLARAFRLPSLKTLFLTSFLFQGGFTFFTAFASVYLIERFGFNQGDIGEYFAYIGIWIAFTQGVITRIVSGMKQEADVLKWTLALTGIVIGIHYIPYDWRYLLLLGPFLAIFIGLSQANLTALISRSADGSIQGEVLGINSSIVAIAQVIPAALAGFIAARVTPITPILVSAVVVFISGIAFNALYKRATISA